MSENIMLIVNPVAGKGRAKFVLSGVLQELCSGGRAVTVYMTEYAGHGENLAREHGAEYDVVACMGGDGTLSRVINGLMHIPAETRPRLGYIPLGTTNDMAASIGIRGTPRQAAKRIIEGAPIPIDAGSLSDGTFFGYVMAFGAFITVPFETPQDAKNRFGWLAYLMEGAASLPNISPHLVKVEYDGGVLEEECILGAVSNSTSVAGLLKFDKSTVALNDGLFEVLLIKHPVNPVILNAELASILTQKYNSDYITILHTRRVRITTDEEVVWTRDGENGGAHTVLEAEVVPSALRFIV